MGSAVGRIEQHRHSRWLWQRWALLLVINSHRAHVVVDRMPIVKRITVEIAITVVIAPPSTRLPIVLVNTYRPARSNLNR